MNAKVLQRVGIVGCGAVTKEFYAPLLPRIPDIIVIGVSDKSNEAMCLVARDFHCKTMSYAELLKSCDIVIVATPPSSHYSLAIEALKSGVSVILEKPFVATHKEGKDILHCAAVANKQVYVAHFRRFLPGAILARNIILSRLLGTVIRIEAFEGGRFTWETMSGYVTTDSYGGVLYDTGSHTLDLALFAAGLDCVSLDCIVSKVIRDKTEPAHEIVADFWLQASNSRISGTLGLSRYGRFANTITLICDHGFLRFSTGSEGHMTVMGPNGHFHFTTPGTMESSFLQQYLDIFRKESKSCLVGNHFLNQIMILEKIHDHNS